MTSDVGGNLEIISLNRFLGPVDDYVTTNSPVKKVTCPSEGTNQIQKKNLQHKLFEMNCKAPYLQASNLHVATTWQ